RQKASIIFPRHIDSNFQERIVARAESVARLLAVIYADVTRKKQYSESHYLELAAAACSSKGVTIGEFC
ncbi:hypothetical protein TNIN_137511, partial [Trichonephila inaurata madagascariensis]